MVCTIEAKALIQKQNPNMKSNAKSLRKYKEGFSKANIKEGKAMDIEEKSETSASSKK
jgi:hypothetical protein